MSRFFRFLPVLLLTYGAAAQDNVNISWDPITDAERQLKAPVVEKDAGVEALFWNVHVEDLVKGEDTRRVLKHYIRLKIFDEKGKEKAATIDIEFGNKTAILNVAARTIKADGTIVEMKRDAVFQRDLVRAGGRKVKVKSFAVPGVEPGAIVEYRYTESREDPYLLYARLQLQREYPVQKVTYYVKALSREVTSYRMAVWPFNCKPSPLKSQGDGSDALTLENVPAFHEEPLMFGEANVRPWVLLLYRQDENREPEKYWANVGKKSYEQLKQSLKVTDDIKQAVAAATGNATSNEDKIAALIRYIGQHTRGLYDSGVTDAERGKVKMPKDRSRTAAEILKSGLGTSDERNLLFAAMAAGAGLEARPVLLPNRQDILFDPRMADEYFLDSVDMAVKFGDSWKIYDVSARELPPGMLTWQEEGVPSLLADPKKPTFITSPLAPPEASLIRRTAKLTLSEDGTLEGDVDLSLAGHSGADRRHDLEGESDEKRQQMVKDEILAVFTQADVSQISLKNLDDAVQPLQVHYHIKVPGYATKTAKRFLFQPLFFQRGSTPKFTAATRRYPIAFPYAWKESDSITVKLPAGFTLERAEHPAEMVLGRPGSYTYSVDKTADGELSVTREFIFGREGTLNFEQTTYSQLKSVFDEIYARDTHAVSLTQGGGAQ